MDENFNERPSFDVDCPRTCGKMLEIKRSRSHREFECAICHWVARISTRQRITLENFYIALMYIGIFGFVGGLVLGFLLA